MTLIQCTLLILILGNLLFAALVFILLGKPRLVLGFLCRLTGEHSAWLEGRMTEAAVFRLTTLGTKLGVFGLFPLFVWSFCSGVLLRGYGV